MNPDNKVGPHSVNYKCKYHRGLQTNASHLFP